MGYKVFKAEGNLLTCTERWEHGLKEKTTHRKKDYNHISIPFEWIFNKLLLTSIQSRQANKDLYYVEIKRS